MYNQYEFLKSRRCAVHGIPDGILCATYLLHSGKITSTTNIILSKYSPPMFRRRSRVIRINTKYVYQPEVVRIYPPEHVTGL